MSDKDKLIILALFFVFFASFFGIFILGPNRPDSELFQYLFFIAALTMAFTGFLGSTGTFTTKGQTLGGGAAIFLIMGFVVVTVRPYLGDGRALQTIKQEILKYEANLPPSPSLTSEEVVTRVKTKLTALQAKTDDLTECQARLTKVKPQKLILAIRRAEGRQPLIKPEDDDSFFVYVGDEPAESKMGKYEVSIEDLRDNYLSITPRSEKLQFGPEALFKYNSNIPEVQLFVRGNK